MGGTAVAIGSPLLTKHRRVPAYRQAVTFNPDYMVHKMTVVVQL